MALTSTSSSSSRSSSILDDSSNPLYLHHEESPGAVLVYQPLVGENYPTWARSMRMALVAKNKLGFIDGTLTLSSPMVKTSSAIQAWVHCDKMVASWILNSVSQEIATSIVYKDTALAIWNDLRERLSQANGPRVFQLQKDIAGITQGQSSITSYFTQLNVLWDQLQKFRPFPMCSCGFCTCNLGQKLNDLQHQDLVMQFLMGLNDSYAQVRAQILLMDPLPPINEVYSLLIQEERHCSVGNNSSPHVESSTPVTKVSSSSGNKNNKNSKGKEKHTCNHCGMNGHTVEKNSSSASTSFMFTQEQCQLFLAMLGTNSTSMAEFVANSENSDPGGPTIREERKQSIKESASIASLFPPNNSDTDDSSESNGTPPRFSHYSNSIMELFSPARSSDSENYLEIVIPNSSIPHFFPLPNGPTTSFSIPIIFPPTTSETETEDGCSESNKTPRAETQLSYSIVPLLPPARSQTETDNSSSDNYEIIPTDPSISASPRRTIRTVIFNHLTEFLKLKSSNSPKFYHPKKNSILSFFSAAKDLIEIIERKQFPLRMLHKATNNFSEDHKIGKGCFGSVYRATLDGGQEVTIKRQGSARAFLIELKALFHLNHKNVACLVGFCEDSNEYALVYEYMKNGTLHDHLHELQSTPLMSSWTARIKVALDIARGIEYLHVYAVPQIIHRNIKSSNILLDATWTAKVFDFCLSEKAPMDFKSHHLDCVAGTIGYMDPEYFSLRQLTTKIDVYSFGVVLLEMLSGYKALHKNENGEQRLIVDFIVPFIAQDQIHRVLDPKVPPPTPVERKAVAHVGSLAVACVSLKGRDRPSMTEIVNNLMRVWVQVIGG